MKSALGRLSFVVILFLFVSVTSRRAVSAQGDVVHVVSGIVKHIDRDTRTIVMKTDKGVEHTVKWKTKQLGRARRNRAKEFKYGSRSL